MINKYLYSGDTIYQFLFHNNLGNLAPERLTNVDFNEARDDGVAVHQLD